MKKRIKKAVGLAAGLMFAFLFLSADALAAEAGSETVNGHVISSFGGALTADVEANVRALPGTDGEILGRLAQGQVVNACGTADNGWYQIVYGNGIGYVSGRLVTQVPVDAAMQEALAQQAQAVKEQLAAMQEALVQQQAAVEAAQATLAQQEAEAALAQQQAALAAAALSGSGNVIFVGDSRTGQMGNAVGGTAAYPDAVFVSCYGGGNEWLSTAQAKAEIDSYVKPGSVLVINYGVNDLSKHNEYISTINKYAQDWRGKGATVYFATVGPVGENEYGKRNWAVEYFNDQLSNRLDGSIGRIPLYRYLVMTGYTTTYDGLHYTADTYARMFQYLMQSIGKM